MPGIPPQGRVGHMATFYTAAVTVTVVSGICALVALAAGSPLQFGSALALFGAGWIAADFVQTAVERERERATIPTIRCAVPAAPPSPSYRPCRVLYVGGGRRFSQTAQPAPGIDAGKLAA